MAAAALGVTWVGARVLGQVDSFARHALVKAVRAENCLFLRLASCRMPSLCKADSSACSPAKYCLRCPSSNRARLRWLSLHQLSGACLAGSRQAATASLIGLPQVREAGSARRLKTISLSWGRELAPGIRSVRASSKQLFMGSDYLLVLAALLVPPAS